MHNSLCIFSRSSSMRSIFVNCSALKGLAMVVARIIAVSAQPLQPPKNRVFIFHRAATRCRRFASKCGCSAFKFGASYSTTGWQRRPFSDRFIYGCSVAKNSAPARSWSDCICAFDLNPFMPPTLYTYSRYGRSQSQRVTFKWRAAQYSIQFQTYNESVKCAANFWKCAQFAPLDHCYDLQARFGRAQSNTNI